MGGAGGIGWSLRVAGVVMEKGVRAERKERGCKGIELVQEAMGSKELRRDWGL